MANPFLTRGDKKAKQSPAYWRSKGQEKDLSKRLGGYGIVGSGNKFTKGDVTVTGIARIEAKSTSKLSFPITIDMLEKIDAAAVASDQVPAVVVEFLDENHRPYYEVAIIPLAKLEALIHAAKKNSSSGT